MRLSGGERPAPVRPYRPAMSMTVTPRVIIPTRACARPGSCCDLGGSHVASPSVGDRRCCRPSLVAPSFCGMCRRVSGAARGAPALWGSGAGLGGGVTLRPACRDPGGGPALGEARHTPSSRRWPFPASSLDRCRWRRWGSGSRLLSVAGAVGPVQDAERAAHARCSDWMFRFSSERNGQNCTHPCGAWTECLSGLRVTSYTVPAAAVG